jgi:membrane associated rhomboid family serine protease
MRKFPAFTTIFCLNLLVLIADSIFGIGMNLAVTPVDFMGIPTLHGLVTLITHMFTHANFDHFFGNFLYVTPAALYLEHKLGSLKFTLIWLLSGLGAVLLFMLVPHVNPWGSLIGASGAASGVFAMACLEINESRFVKALALCTLGVIFIQQLIPAIYSSFLPLQIAYWAHVGGILTALVIKAVCPAPLLKELDDSTDSAINGA